VTASERRPAREPERLLAALVLLLGLLATSCVYGRIIWYNWPTLAAPSYFDNQLIRASVAPLPLPVAREARFDVTATERTEYASFDELLKANATRAFVALHDDDVVYERYFGGLSATTQLPSFSMSKTFAALLVGCALDDGLLGSLDDPLVAYVPALASKSGYGEVTLEELLRMTSGIDFDDQSTSGAALYYCTDLRDRMYAYDVKWPPGEHYLYGSVNVQLLWDALHSRLGAKTVSVYFEERVWNPIGAEQPATWSLDSRESGIEKFFAGFNATARDFARLGLLYLHGGTLFGRRIVSDAWVERSLSPDPVAGEVHTTDGTVRRGKYQWFLTLDGRAYFAKGFHGQYVFVVPEKHAVFVRFGEGYGDVRWVALFEQLADRL
jgi:CubicO group peptidase (beta-lactamase class C family)